MCRVIVHKVEGDLVIWLDHGEISVTPTCETFVPKVMGLSQRWSASASYHQRDAIPSRRNPSV